ncbi:site-2 protease family protein [candidate division KSB3 bacterium]|nr:site-2 protease family protein [candidate division KSB3 bacterium]
MVFAILVPALLLSLTLHEFAHARIALRFGDPTALQAGRVTLNPLRHLDPLGTILLLLVGFGWAKPVPVNPYNLHPRRMGQVMVSLAGPLSNLCLAILAGCLLKIVFSVISNGAESQLTEFIGLALIYLMTINLVLFTFNLIPLFPLDGHHIVREMLPVGKQADFMQWQMKYGMWGLVLLLAGPGIFSQILQRPMPDPLHWLLNIVMTNTTHMLGLM